MKRTHHSQTNRSMPGFTIVEVMIALAASLLLMLGLTRAYKMIGDRITESQSKLVMGSTLRDIAFRLRDELRRSTTDMSPPGRTSNGDGYLVYYEGPFSDATTVLGDAPPQPPNVPEPIPDYYPTSRFSDIDDYLAFTARAEEGSPFIGFIPAGVLMAHRYADGNMTATEIANYTNADAVTPVPFYSNHAEIAYWLSPRWARTPNGDIAYDPGSGHPLYPDLNGDQLPDRLDLHRRVLLIRPDLNMKPSRMAAVNGAGSAGVDWHLPQLPFLIATASGPRIQPLTSVAGTNQLFFDGANAVVAPGAWTSNLNTVAPHWLSGLARMQQVMDLSLSRINDTWSVPRNPGNAATNGSQYGMPSSIVQSNSLADLARPENRFAHVRIPEILVSGSANGSTMPQIALSPPHPYLTIREGAGIFPAQADHNVGASGPGTLPQFGYGRFTLVGFLRPEFNLADRVSDDAAGGSDVASVNRGGSDIIASDVIGFDLQAFDPSAPKYVWVGPDGASGTIEDDDADGNGRNFDFDELGFAFTNPAAQPTDDELVTLDALRSLDVLLDIDGLEANRSLPVNTAPDLVNRAYPDTQPAPYTGPGPHPNVFHLVDRGSFVDLNYTRQAGGAMRGLIHGSAPPLIRIRELAGTVSGLELFPPGSTSPAFNFPTSWERAGRFVISRNPGVNTVSSFYQPVFDTWTDNYGKDEFDQEGASMPIPPSFPFGALTIQYEERFGGTAVARNVQYRQWSNQAGVTTDPGFAGQDAGNAVGALTGSTTPIASTPPIQDKIRALKVTIRVFDQSAGQIRQQTVIEDF